MKNYTDYQNYLLNKLAYIDLSEDTASGMSLLECIPDEYKPFREELKAAGLGNLVLKDYANNNEGGSRSGFCAIAFEDPETNAVGVSYRGTENLGKKDNQIDMVDNIYTAVLGTSDQKREALDFFEKNMNTNGDNFLFGHSKGGELASEVYAKHHKIVLEMHLYNPQPINDRKLNKEQENAFKSDKVDVVIIDGDFVSRLGEKSIFGDRISYMKCNGKEDTLVYPHLLEAASFNEDQSIMVEPNPYVKYPDQKAIGDLAETVVSAAQWGLLPKNTMLVLTIAKTYEFIVQDLPNMVDAFEKAIDSFLDMLDEAKDKVDEIKAQLKQFVGGVKQRISTWYNKNFNSGYHYASENSFIKVDTGALRTYADRLARVNSRISKLDRRLDTLYGQVGLRDLWSLLQADVLTGYSWRLTRCINYLNDTAYDFESVERSLTNQL